MYGARTPRMFQLVFVVDNETGEDFCIINVHFILACVAGAWK